LEGRRGQNVGPIEEILVRFVSNRGPRPFGQPQGDKTAEEGAKRESRAVRKVRRLR